MQTGGQVLTTRVGPNVLGHLRILMDCGETRPKVQGKTGFFFWKKPAVVIMGRLMPYVCKLTGLRALISNIFHYFRN